MEVYLTRKDFVADGAPQMAWECVCSGKEKQVMGLYRLTMKTEKRKIPHELHPGRHEAR